MKWYDDYLFMIQPAKPEEELGSILHPVLEINKSILETKQNINSVMGSPLGHASFKSCIEMLGELVAAKECGNIETNEASMINEMASTFEEFYQKGDARSVFISQLHKSLEDDIGRWSKYLSDLMGPPREHHFFVDTESGNIVSWTGEEDFKIFLEKLGKSYRIGVDVWEHRSECASRYSIYTTIRLSEIYFDVKQYVAELEKIETPYRNVSKPESRILGPEMVALLHNSVYWWYHVLPENCTLYNL